MSKVKTSEILTLLKDHRFDEIIDRVQDINQPIDDIRGYTALMYATAYGDEEAIKFLLGNGANPFKEDDYGNSAFSIAFRQELEDIAKEFVLSKANLDTLAKEHNNLAIALCNQDKGNFSYYVASHICTNDSELRTFLGFDNEGAKRCFTYAKDYYELLGDDGTSLLQTYEIE
jgi:ankyrin repeat protein